MAKDTQLNLGKTSIYQVLPFIYTKEGTLRKLSERLKEIKEMGFDFIYLLPIHERGVLNRKGTYGSPYAIKDYYSIDANIGTMEDFESFISKAHSLGLKVMMDIVINHSACDSVYVKTHPEFYLKDEKGNITRKVADWSDIYDYDYNSQELKDEMLKMLEFWARKGVDGYRCDVASLVPLDLWIKARKQLKAINPDFVMVAESVHQELIRMARVENYEVSSDNDLFEAFDILYSYDIYNEYMEAVQTGNLKRYTDVLNYQQNCFPKNALKLMHLENHDQPRIFSLLKDKDKVKNWTAFSFLTKGASFVYAGQECFDDHKPDFFEKEDIDWTKKDEEFISLIKKLNELKKNMFKDDEYADCLYTVNDEVLIFKQRSKNNEYLGVFNVNLLDKEINVDFEDGTYVNLIDGENIIVSGGKIKLTNKPLLIK